VGKRGRGVAGKMKAVGGRKSIRLYGKLVGTYI
jgi:hypothetical protein